VILLNRITIIAIYIIVVSSLFLTCSIPPIVAVHAQDSDPLFSTTSSPYGTSFQEWTQKWWQWEMSIPRVNNHNYEKILEAKYDATKDIKDKYQEVDCSYKQVPSSPVFFLPYVLKEKGRVASHTCTVPEDKAIMIGIDNGLMDNGDPKFRDAPISELITAVIETNKFPNPFKITLDGIPLNFTNDEKFKVTSIPFKLELKEGNRWDEPEGKWDAVADGWYLILKPLDPGNHVLKYDTGYVIREGEGGQPEGYEQSVTYNIIVNSSAI
jgi:hypothetical protein